MTLRQSLSVTSRPRSGLALGGLGTGCFELRPDGLFRNWTITNNTPQFPAPRFPEPPFREESFLFFAVRWQEKGALPQIKLLQVEPENVVSIGSIDQMIYMYPWMSGVAKIDYEASFPFTRLRFTDPAMPFEVEMEAWSPFIPHDVKNSALPVASFDFRIKSKTSKPVEVMILASQRNLVGYSVDKKLWAAKVNECDCGITVEMTAEMDDKTHWDYGTMALASLGKNSTYYAGWEHIHPYYDRLIREPKLGNVNDTEGRNLAPAGQPAKAMQRYWSSVAQNARLTKKGQESRHTFALAWHFPNLYTNNFGQGTAGVGTTLGSASVRAGHYYSQHFADAGQVVSYFAQHRDDLYTRTRGFHDDFRASTLPGWLLDQVNSHLNTLVSSSWLTEAGDFAVLEGIGHDSRTVGGVASIDVALYGAVMATALFPTLDQTTWAGHARAQHPGGNIEHTLTASFGRTGGHVAPKTMNFDYDRLDLPADFALLVLRNYFTTGDLEYLRELWPNVKKALDYSLTKRDKDGDSVPDMEGIMCSYDNFPMFGASSYVGSMFVAAVAQAAVAAKAVGDEEAAARYAQVRDKGRAVLEEKLWNGQYYRLCSDDEKRTGKHDEGCLIDQLIGQWCLRLVGLGSLLDPQRVRTAIKSILKRNATPWGLRNCTWPGDKWLHDFGPNIWVDQANTAWTGVELTFAALLIREGMVKEGLAVAKSVDDRYREGGLYFDHQECGGHYLRPMASWDILHALLGLTITAGTPGLRYEFAPKIAQIPGVPGVKGKATKSIFAFAGGWAHYAEQPAGKGRQITLDIRSGKFTCKELVFPANGVQAAKVAIKVGKKTLGSGEYSANVADGKVTLTFAKPLTVSAGEQVTVRL